MTINLRASFLQVEGTNVGLFLHYFFIIIFIVLFFNLKKGFEEF